jgi:hypothetical protein
MAERFQSLLTDGVEKRVAADVHERLILERTRRFLRYRNQLIGFAVAYSLLPFLSCFATARSSGSWCATSRSRR